MKVGFVGLGAICRPMADRVADAGFELTVWNRTLDKARAFASETGARCASTPAEAARDAEIVVTCLSTSADVEQVVGQPNGLLAGLGDAAVLERARPVLAAFGQKIVHCGGVGAGDLVKAMNQALLAIHIWSAAEALAAVVKGGVSPRVALDVINASSGRSNASMNLFPERVLTRAFPRTFRLALLDKDVNIAADVARDEQVPAPFFELAAGLFKSAHKELGEEADHVEAVKGGGIGGGGGVKKIP